MGSLRLVLFFVQFCWPHVPRAEGLTLPIQLKHFNAFCFEGLERNDVGKGEAFTSQILSGCTSLSTQDLKNHTCRHNGSDADVKTVMGIMLW